MTDLEGRVIAIAGAHRAPVLLAGTIEVDRRKKPVKIRNFSAEGALIEGDMLPKEGSTSSFARNDLRLKVKVVWVQGRYAGIAFERPLNADEVLRHVPQPRARLAQDFKRPGLACRPLTSYERRMIERALRKHGWNISLAASELGLTRGSLYRRMEKHGL